MAKKGFPGAGISSKRMGRPLNNQKESPPGRIKQYHAARKRGGELGEMGGKKMLRPGKEETTMAPLYIPEKGGKKGEAGRKREEFCEKKKNWGAALNAKAERGGVCSKPRKRRSGRKQWGGGKLGQKIPQKEQKSKTDGPYTGRPYRLGEANYYH